MFGPYPSTISLFANVVFVLFLLVGLNALLQAVRAALAFSQGELLTLYTMLAISTGLAGSGRRRYPQPDDSAWRLVRQDQQLGQVPGRLSRTGWWSATTTSCAATSSATPPSIAPDVLRAWIMPILAWTRFITLLMFVAHCINVLVRRQWADRERLTFPIIWLPMEMTEGGTGAAFFRNRLMWAGFRRRRGPEPLERDRLPLSFAADAATSASPT